MLDDIKMNLRISHDALDMEIFDLIESAKMQLMISGISESAIDGQDSLVKRAIILYCKANFGLDNKDSEKYQARFESLVNHMSMCPEYKSIEVI